MMLTLRLIGMLLMGLLALAMLPFYVLGFLFASICGAFATGFEWFDCAVEWLCGGQ